MERIAHGTEDYCPGNLPTNATVVTTSTHDAIKDAAITARAAETQKVLQDAHAHSTPLLHQAHREVSIGRNSYRLFAVSCIGAVALVASITVANGIEPGYNFGYVSAVASQLPNYLVAALAVAGGLIGSFALAAYCDKGMLQRFSSFWFKQQKELRRALKDARRTAIQQSAGIPVQRAQSVDPKTDPISVLRLTPDSNHSGHPPTRPVR
jgi:hypothetical protein